MIQPVLNQFSIGTVDSQTFAFMSLYVGAPDEVALGLGQWEKARGKGESLGAEKQVSTES